jgi:hypothetical protein
MRHLKFAVIGLFAFVAVAAGLFVAALTVMAGLLAAVARQLTGRRHQAAGQPDHSRRGRRPLKTINAVDVTVTHVSTEPVSRIERA